MSARGSVYRRESGTWTAHVTWKQDGKRRQRKSGGHGTEAEAQEELTKMLRAMDLGVTASPDRVTVAQYLHGWIEHLEHVVGRKPTTVAEYRSKIATYVLPPLGDRPLQRVTVEEVDGIYARMKRRGLSASTVRQLHAILNKAFGDAERKGIVAFNVVRRSSPPSARAAKAPTFPTWTAEQLGSFLDLIEGRQKAAPITFAATTGARLGEVVALRWSDVDLDRGVVTIARSASVAAGVLAVTDTKTHRQRPVGLDDDLVALLRRHRIEQHAWRLQVGRYWEDLNLVFPGPGGEYMKPGTLTQQFERLTAAAGLPRIRFHDLRHSHATLLVDDGVDAKTVSERLGHSTVAFTMDRYVHPTPESQREAANRLSGRVRGRPRGGAERGAR